ncbi:MAG: ABC transporter substrate-binding protein, partial [Cytophagaceae bacterium]|nr:ABC transporter substrate-binding protein [Gemmatimonadaceae bacterium]
MSRSTRPTHAPAAGRSTLFRCLVSFASVAVVVAACSSQAPPPTGGVAPIEAAAPGSATGTLRLGYFPNITHATALVGVESGLFNEALGPGVTFEISSFNAGGAASEALLNGAIDATYIGPNPAINAFAQSQGAAIRIIAGATSGGAYLVVKPEIVSVADLRGKKLATPQLGNTQDVALR